MFHPYWFGVKVEFVCSLCCITSVERNVINSTTQDIEKIKAKINAQSLTCLHCGAPLGRGTEVDVAILPGTPEYLQGQGFVIPTKQMSQGRKRSDRE